MLILVKKGSLNMVVKIHITHQCTRAYRLSIYEFSVHEG